MSHKRATQRGFTLAEVLVGIAVFALIFVAALVLYDRANKIFKSSMEASDVQQNTRVAFERLMAELRMAGFDFDRDGYPQGSQKYQQPDEQLEYVHKRAITFRANLDYESDAATDNGRETAYEPGFSTTATDTSGTTDDYFPIVTTANDEIVTYYLKSDSGTNDDTIRFYADVARPRRTFPVSGTGQNETEVVIPNVELCQDASGNDTGCLQPPYTLYRVTLKNDGTVGPEVPVAKNIRNLAFTYYKDTAGAVVATPNGGGGQYTVSTAPTAATLAAREVRATIRGMHVNLVGMSQTPDSAYREPLEATLPTAEQVAAAAKHRQYKLESTLIPRNLGKRGLQEIDTKIPGRPQITVVCAVGCGVVKVKWNAPGTGTVNAYSVVYDTSATGAFNSTPIDAGRNLFAYVYGLTPGGTYYFKVVAENANGTNYSDVSSAVVVINRTRAEAPTNIVGSGGTATGAPAAVDNRISVRWLSPQANVAFNAVNPTNSCGESESLIGSQSENSGYTIKRSTTAGFDPATTGTVIFNGPLSAAGAPTVDSVGNATFSDASPKINCVPYYYAVRMFENGCSTVAANNSSGDVNQAISAWSTVGDGRSSASVPAATPVNPTIAAGTTCATNPCTIVVRWPEVTQDTATPAAAPIQVQNYEIRRRTWNGSAFQDEQPPVLFADSTVGDGTVTYATTAPVPPAGHIYHYAVRALNCSTTSPYSATEARFPCSILTITPGATVIIDGDGTSTSPWMTASNTADVAVLSSTNLTAATATVRQMPAGAPASLGNGIVGGNTAAWSFPMPGVGGVFEITMTLTDINGCVTTETRYYEEAPVSCCLRPYKDATGTIFDSSILALQNPAPNSGDMTVTIKLQNDCDDVLTLDSMRMGWTGFGGGGSDNDLVRATFPRSGGGTVSETYGPDIDGAHSWTMASVTNAATTIGANGSYNVVLTFSRAQSTTATTVSNFCIRYTRNGITFEDCKIVQNAGPSCP